MKKFAGMIYTICLWVGILLVMGSLGYIGYTFARVHERKHAIEESREQFVKTAKVSVESHPVDETEPQEVQQPKEYENAIGYIEIAKLDIVLPIFEGTGSQELRDGVGVVEGTSIPTEQKNTVSVIAGHRGGYNGAQTFLHIDQLEKGDEIKVTTKEKELIYHVTGQEVIESTDWTKFTKEKDETKLILLSCHPYPKNTDRILIYSKLAEVRELQ